MPDISLGAFEQVVLLAIIKEGKSAFALEVRRGIEKTSGRRVSRGAFYTTLERLKNKGFVNWVAAQPDNARRSGTQRMFTVTPKGMKTLRETYRVLRDRSASLEEVFERI